MPLGGVNDFTFPQPAGKQIKKMHGMFNEDAAAFFFIPKPVAGFKVFITGIILKKSVEKFPQHFLVHNIADNGEQWIVTLHQINGI
jgi:hypothetical protein